MKRVIVCMFGGMLVVGVLVSCGQPQQTPSSRIADLKPASLKAGVKLKVVATTSIVADLVANVGGDLIELRQLLPLGVDPHAFEPTPQDATRLANAQVILANGAGLEEFLLPLLENAGAQVPVIELSEGVSLRAGPAEERGNRKRQGQAESPDPHIWTNPQNAIIMVQNIQRALSALDPANAVAYQTKAATYVQQIKELDAWVQAQIDALPAANRRLVADHESLGYYAERYGLETVGAVIPSVSTLAEPSAQQLATLVDAVRQQGIRAIFVDTVANPTLAQRLAEDTGAKLVRLYSGSLGPAGSGAETYIAYTRYNTTAIVGALR